MKRILKRTLLLFFVACCFYTTTKAQKLYVKENSGAQSEYSLSDLRKLTFLNQNLIITPFSGNITQTPIANVRYMSFTNYSIGIATINASAIQIYPNPAVDELRFMIDEVDKINKITIYDVSLKVVFHSTIISNNSVNVSSLKSGVYLLEIMLNNQRIIKKFVKL